MSITVQLGLLLFLFVSAVFLFGMNLYFFAMQRKRKLRRQIESRYQKINQTNADQSYYSHR